MNIINWSKENKKNILIIILLLIALIGILLSLDWYSKKVDHGERTVEDIEKPQKVRTKRLVQSLNIQTFNEYVSDADSSLTITEKYDLKDMKVDDTFNVKFSFQLENSIKIKYMEFDLDIGESLELESPDLNEKDDVKTYTRDDLNYKIDFKYNNSIQKFGDLKVKVVSDDISNAYIKVKNIILVDKDGNYYKMPNSAYGDYSSAYSTARKLYFYKNETGEYDYVIDNKEEHAIVSEYRCAYASCWRSGYYKNIQLIHDGNYYLLYDVESNKKIESVDADYARIESNLLVYEHEHEKVFVKNLDSDEMESFNYPRYEIISENEDYDGSTMMVLRDNSTDSKLCANEWLKCDSEGLYSLTYGKWIVPVSEGVSIVDFSVNDVDIVTNSLGFSKRAIAVYRNKKYELYDFKGEAFNLKSIRNIYNDEYNIVSSYNYRVDGYVYFLFDQNGNFVRTFKNAVYCTDTDLFGNSHKHIIYSEGNMLYAMDSTSGDIVFNKNVGNLLSFSQSYYLVDNNSKTELYNYRDELLFTIDDISNLNFDNATITKENGYILLRNIIEEEYSYTFVIDIENNVYNRYKSYNYYY